jgi:D-alanyl-D-alanine carboxypeptidase
MTMKLIEEGFISLDETIGRYLPELPRSEKITVRMLLNHTSGLQDYLNNPEIERKLADPYYVWTREEVLGSVKRVVFEPGSAYGYSNTNFVALGTIIELASRNSVAALFRKVILEPLALRHAYFDPDPGAAPSFAHGYVIRANNPVDTFPPDGSVPTGIWGSVWTDGGLATNSADIAVFTDAYLGGRLLKKETMETVLDFGRYDYGLGVSLWRGSGRAWWGHSGGYYGYEAESWTDLSRNLTIAVCVNSSEPSGSADRIWRLLEAAYTKSGIPRGVTREWLQSAPK